MQPQVQQLIGIILSPGIRINMEITFENIYDILEQNKKDLNFISREDVVMEFGTSKFSTLFYNEERDDIPENIRNFLIKQFNITDNDYDFIQIQKYEIGDYILPHKDSYPCFGLVMLSTSSVDGLVVQQRDGTYKFHLDKAGTFIDVPKFSWHWVNPIQEKTRYTAVYGLHPLNNLDIILDQ
jgi:hypothetical protein